MKGLGMLYHRQRVESRTSGKSSLLFHDDSMTVLGRTIQSVNDSSGGAVVQLSKNVALIRV